MKKLAVIAACALVLLTACGNSQPKRAHQPQSTAPPATAVAGADGVQHASIEMTDALRFVPDKIVMKPGRIVIDAQNRGAVPHTFDVKSASEGSGAIDGGSVRHVAFTVNQPGQYQFTCAFHVAEEMVGTLVVQG